ncbi:aldehyde dehydrogenase family protein [Patulibacter sp. SYSU D01012]|uniref:aldehyde dehydrogenase family protein n=1 Tax=Patulibacter sp. SYSU D01012 TaxID=2817381 RepID=UPI001B303E4B|nr:aldehyde dehydrogenase family protein [Patulibacter sp. SYSU D01012]
MSPRLTVRKTYKAYIGDAFVRSESGRTDPAHDHQGALVANVPRCSRKDVRDAVKAAVAAFPGWAGRTAYNRGQILYRAAEAVESRGDEFVAAAVRVRGLKEKAARAEVEAAVDTLVHYAGWTDKIGAVLGGVNPVAAPYLSFSVPEPTGVIGVVCPPEADLLGTVAAIAPPLAAGNVVVALLSERWPTAGLDLGEALGVSDVPKGVVALLSGRTAELAPALAAHRGVDGLLDASGDADLRGELGRLGAETISRVRHVAPAALAAAETRLSLSRIEPWTELKTAWHPVGA